MTIDAVVVTYESAPHLPACLTALAAAANIIVVDNASSDGSVSVAREFGALVVRNARNEGFAAAANRGARLGRSDLLLFLNPDAILDRIDLDRLVASLEPDRRLFAASPRLYYPDGTEQQAWWPFPSPGGTWSEALGLHRLYPPRLGPGGRVPFVVGTCMLTRRRYFEALDGFDERFWLYGEEADLCYRARERGWGARFVPDARAWHVGGASGHAIGELSFEHFQRGAEHFILKHHGRTALFLHRLGLLTGSVLRLPPLYASRGPTARPRLRRRQAMTARLATVLMRYPTRVTP